MTTKEVIENFFNSIDLKSYLLKSFNDMVEEQYYRDAMNSFRKIEKPTQKLLEYKEQSK